MNKEELEIKLTFISGLKEIILQELGRYSKFHIIRTDDDSLYLQYTKDLEDIKKLRSVSKAYIVIRNSKYNPSYISKHKVILGNLIEIVTDKNKKEFKNFKITCAGSDSPEVLAIVNYVQERYGLIEKEEADMKIHIVKVGDTWETGIQITPRPLSVRSYKIKNMSGAMDPTIAYAVNSLCELETKSSYLNIFSGSATLLIEAGQCYPDLKNLVGFDNNKEHISLAMQNIKKAGLIKKIRLYEKDIFEKPEIGIFDVITSDLPFGMSISKDENLEILYKHFVEYCQGALNNQGILVVYTSEHKLLKEIILKSNFRIVKTIELKFITVVNAYLRPQIFICKFK